MFPFPPYPDEKQRLAAVHSYHILDTLEEADFDELTTLASAICQVPIALITLLDEKRQWFKSHKGLDISETPIEYSFCAHAIVETKDIMIIEDAHTDHRFKNNPFVKGKSNVTFYAGVPLINEDGFPLGTLCVIDSNKRKLTTEQEGALKILARQVMAKLELRKKLRELKLTNEALLDSRQSINGLIAHLERTQDKMNMALQSAQLGIWNYMLESDDFTMSDIAKILHGIHPDDNITYAAAHLLIDEAHRNNVQQHIDHAIATKNTFYIDYLINPLNKEPPRWLRACGKAYYDIAGNALQISGILVDISTEKLV